jgi:hypothetical protein
MAKSVIGQTGKTVLSDNMIQFKASYKKTVRYRYQKMTHGWLAQVIGPFHSRLYGACSFGTLKRWAKVALKNRLGKEYGYIGTMLFSDVDTSDTVGEVDSRLLDEGQLAHPITLGELIGQAGQ